MAQSCVRAGLSPIGVDLFGDQDLAACGPTRTIPPVCYPRGFEASAIGLEGLPWMFGGGLENHPEVLDRLRRYGPCWGASADAILRVRDLDWLAQCAHRANAILPARRATPEGLPTDGSWLDKPRLGSGGGDIRPWVGGPIRENRIWQQYVQGEPRSACFLGDGRSAWLVGASLQLVGVDAAPAPFAWCGNIGPIPIEAPEWSTLVRLGDAVASEGPVRGWFGIDYLLADERVVVLEVNPRYPGSYELLERSGGPIAAAAQRALAGERRSLSSLGPMPKALDAEVWGKRIVYAPCDGQLRLDASAYRSGHDADVQFADIPRRGTRFRRGEPVLTVLARSASALDCRDRLRSLADAVVENDLLELAAC